MSQKIKQERIHLNTFYRVSIAPIPKLNKDRTKKENYRPIPYININTKGLNKILANKVQEYIKRIIHHHPVWFILGMQGWFNTQKSINGIHYINILKTNTT